MKFDFNANINESNKSDLTFINFEIKKCQANGDYEKLRRLLKLKQEIIRKNNEKKQFLQKPKISNNALDSNQEDISYEQHIEAEHNVNDETAVLDNTPIQTVNVTNSKLGRLVDTDNLALRASLEKIADIHEKILDLYEMSLYEEDWDDVKIREFENLLSDYNQNLDYIKSCIPNIQWNSESNKKEFMRIYNEVLNADGKSWNRVYARHNNYRRYRTNRKSIILQICDVLGGLKNNKDTNYQGIFKYFNDRLANVKLYDNTDLKNRKFNLDDAWLKKHLNEIMDDLKDSAVFNSGAIDGRDIFKVFHVYVKCRRLAYAIFNLMTSNSEFNGYDKWHNKFIDYCDANLNDRQVEQLINAVDSESQFEDVDDYQNTMDEEAWERQGLYESWLDDSLEYYHSHKDRYNKSKINKITMIPTNANQCRVQCDGTYVYANTTFYPGDIIEICPTKKIDKSSLYSRDMRDSVFEVVPNKEWVLPFGYCRYYLHDVSNDDANCTYIWDPIKSVIVIRATKRIPKYSKLFLSFIV